MKKMYEAINRAINEERIGDLITEVLRDTLESYLKTKKGLEIEFPLEGGVLEYFDEERISYWKFNDSSVPPKTIYLYADGRIFVDEEQV